ncbi:hypothetical protein FD755_019431 [Muntiacus reevesi]|uniref:D-glutamate cyclase-like C-terminal domain-containing protein n=1 Tax=Muntiacus reevesi TaxID=9886 RepID=A0A5N3X8G1_MUNRE|nr:hypothetical protein FD755_019431 [Muntiacus reevesi]
MHFRVHIESGDLQAFLCVPRMGSPQFGECDSASWPRLRDVSAVGPPPCCVSEVSFQPLPVMERREPGVLGLRECRWSPVSLPDMCPDQVLLVRPEPGEHAKASSSVSCAIIAGFCCPLVITMMPTPKDYTKPRGIHFLFPSEERLGIKDLSKPDYGEVVVCQSGLVPVFWPSQLTSLEAAGSCIIPHWLSPAHQRCTVTTGLKGTATPARRLTPEGIPEIHHVFQDPLHRSTTSASAIQRISELKVISAIDPGNKPAVGRLGSCPGELLRTSQARPHVHSVLLTTGFPMYFNCQPPDRLPGAVALATILQALEKRASMVIDQRALSLHKKLVDEAAEQGEGRSVGDAQAFLCRDGDPKSPSARKRNVEHLGDPIDDLFLSAHKIPGISSPGVGDKGKKLGMDKVKEAMKRHIRNGDILTLLRWSANQARLPGGGTWLGAYLTSPLPFHHQKQPQREAEISRGPVPG